MKHFPLCTQFSYTQQSQPVSNSMRTVVDLLWKTFSFSQKKNFILSRNFIDSFRLSFLAVMFCSTILFCYIHYNYILFIQPVFSDFPTFYNLIYSILLLWINLFSVFCEERARKSIFVGWQFYKRIKRFFICVEKLISIQSINSLESI